ncbi:MAG: amidohydrolase [Pseudomonadales bacterium]|nr:amidohydrolase [Pseudomonadales bacterium]MDG1443323.1 amidohydrolase [Pseudomonadales bacterium]
MSEYFDITVVQSDLVWENIAANIDHFDKLLEIEKFAETSPDLILLPEMFTTGFTMQSQALAETMQDQTVSWLREKSVALNCAIAGSAIIVDEGQFFNRFVLAQPKQDLVWYDKRHLFRMSQENDHYSAGQSHQCLEIGGIRLSPQICYDLRFPAWTRNPSPSALGHYQIQTFVANWPARRRNHWLKLLQARAIENQCYVVGVNRIGLDGNGVEYCGDSVVVDFQGEIILDMKSKAGLGHLSLDMDALSAYRGDFPAWKDSDRFQIET